MIDEDSPKTSTVSSLKFYGRLKGVVRGHVVFNNQPNKDKIVPELLCLSFLSIQESKDLVLYQKNKKEPRRAPLINLELDYFSSVFLATRATCSVTTKVPPALLTASSAV